MLQTIVKKKVFGKHLIIDLYGGKFIENPLDLEKFLSKTSKKCKSKSLKFIYYKFIPQGISGILLLANSHISYHSWPEENYTAIDIFSCNTKIKSREIINYIKKKLLPQRIKVKIIKRTL